MPKIKTREQRIEEYMRRRKEKESIARRKLYKNFAKREKQNKDEAVFDMSKITKYLENISQQFGNKKVKNLSKFQKELMKISKEKDDKKYVQMVIELLIGSGLLITAIVLLLLFLYNPKNDQITFDNTGNNTGNNNNRKSLAEKARNYRDNEKKLNERNKPTHYKYNSKNGKNFFFNTVTRKFDIPSDKYAIIVNNFKEANGIDIANIRTVRQYNSLALITKKVMNNNTKDEKNLDKRKIEEEVDLPDVDLTAIFYPDELKEEVNLVPPVSTKRKIVKVKKKGPSIKEIARRTVKRLKQKQKTPPRKPISVILKTGKKPSPDSVANLFKPFEQKPTIKRIKKSLRNEKLFKDVEQLRNKNLVTI